MKQELREILKQIYINLEPEEKENRAEEFDSMSDDQVARFQLEYFDGEVPTVRTMREAGIEVKIKHSRIHPELGLQRVADLFDIGVAGTTFAAHGGATEAYLTLPSGKTLQGFALCSKSDPWERKVGLRLAIENALGIRQPKFDKIPVKTGKAYKSVGEMVKDISPKFAEEYSATFTA